MISLFWLVSLGLVVTAGAGTVVAYEVCRRYVLGKDAGPWAIATKALRQSWRQATVIGLLAVPVAAAAAVMLRYYGEQVGRAAGEDPPPEAAEDADTEDENTEDDGAAVVKT